jgi:ABC-type oligopeptide transport system substrate-binding subunit/DNA-binding SARP family transcriptional activator
VTALRFYLLGPFEALADERPLLPPPTVKSQSLLAYLLLHRDRPSPRELLAGLFWGDRTDHKARRSLSTALWHIRSCLEAGDLLLGDYAAVQIDPGAGVWVDVEAFESLAGRADRGSLEEAAALYRGSLLPDLYDDWVIDRRYRLEALYLAALARLMRLEERAGAPAAALATARRLLEVDPLREEAHRTAMRAYCRLGDRDAALAQYRAAEGVLERELGTPPVRETRELYQAILDGRVEIGPAPDLQPVPIPDLAASTRGRHPLEAPFVTPLVGREADLARLRRSWEAALSGRGTVVLVEGEAGAGKTRLLDEFAAELRRQSTWTVVGRCYTFERLLSYQPLVEVAGGLTHLLPDAEWEALPGWVAGTIGRLLPGVPAGLEGEGARLFEGLTRFFLQVSARRPLLIALEDLHWATESTLSLVHYLARHLDGHPILLAGTHRPLGAASSHPLNALRAELVREGIGDSWRLEALSEAAVLELVERMSGTGGATAPLARRLFLETEGNPFYLSEIVKALFEAGRLRMEGGRWQGDFEGLGGASLPLPATVRQAILARVGALDDAPRRALELAAVLGREFDFAPFCTLCGRDEDAALERLDTLMRRQLITEGSGPIGRDYAFTHHKIQEVVYGALARRARQRLHGLAGRALEASYEVADGALDARAFQVAGAAQVPGEPGTIPPAELAFHFLEGRAIDPALGPRAAQYLLAAGDGARCLYAHPEAAGYYRQALDILQDENDLEGAARTLTKLGLVYHHAFDFRRARETYEAAFATWRRVDAGPRPAAIAPAPHPLRMQAEEPFQLDPAGEMDSATARVMGALFSGLVQQGQQLEVLPDVAERWDVLEGGRRYAFHLRPDAHWTDGEPVTAGDFICAWRRVLDPATRDEIANRLFDIRGARDWHAGRASDEALGLEAPDERTLVVELESPCGYFLSLMANAVALPVPAHRVAQLGDALAEPRHLVSNGAFRVQSWTRGESMVLVRNPAYHGRFGGNLEGVTLHFVPPWSAGLALYAAGELDLLGITYLRPGDLEAARQLYAGDYRCLSALATGYTAFDTRRPPFDDPRVRQAFALAADRETLATVLRADQVFPATGGFVPPGMPGHTPAIAPSFDPPRARRLLAEAGYPDGRGFPAVGSIIPDVAGSRPVSDFVTGRWRKILGVEVRGRAVALERYRAVIETERPHLVSEALQADFPDPAEFLQGSATLLDTGWHHEGYEALILAARRSLDQAERMRLYADAQRILVEEAPLIPLFYMRTHVLVKPWVHRFPGSGSDRTRWQDLALDPHP